MKSLSATCLLVVALSSAAANDGRGEPGTGPDRPVQTSAVPARLIPATTISPEFAKIWQSIVVRAAGQAKASPAPDDLKAWADAWKKTEAMLATFSDAISARYHVTTTDLKLGDVPVVSVAPENWTDDGRALIYVHGGGFTAMSAHSSLFTSALMAARTGLKVIAIDYTIAPQAHWGQITDQVIAVYRALLASGQKPHGVGIWGDSAGGSIVAGSVLKLRDAETPMPGALVLWAPWADVSMAGDTYATLADFDPSLSVESLKASAAAYANPSDQKNPYVSPVYGDYSKGFPPTLIQAGTREIFLSNAVRQYQAISAAGIPATLDLYEGMPHVFQPMGPDTPEGVLAMRKVVAFWNANLRAQPRLAPGRQ
jgi:acetyl esterase/lipase